MVCSSRMSSSNVEVSTRVLVKEYWEHVKDQRKALCFHLEMQTDRINFFLKKRYFCVQKFSVRAILLQYYFQETYIYCKIIWWKVAKTTVLLYADYGSCDKWQESRVSSFTTTSLDNTKILNGLNHKRMTYLSEQKIITKRKKVGED